MGRVERFAVLTAVLGVAGLLASAVTGEIGEPGLATALLFVATSISVAIPLRFHRREGVEGITLDEAMLVAMLFALPSGQPALLLTLSSLTHVAMRSEPLKVAYNAGNVAVSASAATLVFHHVGTGASVLHPRSLAATLAAVLVYNLVSSFSFSELVHRLDRRPRRETLSEVWQLNVLTLTGNTIFGLLLALVVVVEPFASLLATLLLVGLYLGYRGFAGVIEDRDKADRLHEVTMSLAAGTGTDRAIPEFLDRLTELFSAERADLVTLSEGGDRTLHLADGSEITGAGRVADPLEAALREQGQVRVSMSTSSGAAAYRDALAAPLVIEGQVVGALAVYDRVGLEAWDDADATLLATVAHEAAVAIRNADLVTTLSDESRKLQDIVGAASDGIVLLDVIGVVHSWNPGMARATGVDESDAVGRNWTDSLSLDPDSPDLASEMATVLTTRATTTVDVHLATAEPRWLRCTLSPVVRDGVPDGVVLICRDVTAQIETDALKADFVATVTHELRTPLTPLRGFISTMAARHADMEPAQVDSALGAMSRQVDRLEALVADLLVVADVDRGDVVTRPERIDVGSVASEAAVTEAGDARDRLTVTSAPASADTDPRHVARIVRALVSNALKHTEGAVRIDVARAGDRAVISVADDGPGVASWDRELIFQPFGRAGSTHLRRPTQGPGLGLAIARSLAEAIGGEVTLDPHTGEGATFRLTIPAVDAVTAVA